MGVDATTRIRQLWHPPTRPARVRRKNGAVASQDGCTQKVGNETTTPNNNKNNNNNATAISASFRFAYTNVEVLQAWVGYSRKTGGPRQQAAHGPRFRLGQKNAAATTKKEEETERADLAEKLTGRR